METLAHTPITTRFDANRPSASFLLVDRLFAAVWKRWLVVRTLYTYAILLFQCLSSCASSLSLFVQFFLSVSCAIACPEDYYAPKRPDVLPGVPCADRTVSLPHAHKCTRKVHVFPALLGRLLLFRSRM